MTQEQGERILTTLAYLDEGRNVRALVTEDNLVEYKWISTRMELDLDQLCGQSSGPKKAKTAVEPSTQAAQPKKTTASRPPKRKCAASSLKKPASSKSAAPSVPTVESGGDKKYSVRYKRSRTESRPTPEVVSSHAPSSMGKGVLSPQTRVAPGIKDFEALQTKSIPEFENS